MSYISEKSQRVFIPLEAIVQTPPYLLKNQQSILELCFVSNVDFIVTIVHVSIV
jgi:hypothetical protein